ncbi:hypothetical protein ILUMI_08429 [Ignelater luminosus]|uniref:Lipase domain-containing protein n=1 Tax=Ignelater luminosus TaxID=2038154 RepID=A0A8K0GDE7_IGNLU|nr:hypothetical protein ILUMI_08429 [Ignelater luminosus]
MKLLLGIVVLAILTDISKADFCQTNFTLKELPDGILKEVLSIVTKGVVQDFFGCPEDVKINETDVKLWLFTRQNPDIPVLIDRSNPVQLDTSKPIKMIFHGWLCNITNDEMPDLKTAYLEAYDCNVIALEWTKYAIDLYVNSFCFIPKIAEVIGKFLCYLQQELKVPLSGVHVSGHSMGGQMAGIVGQETQKQCNTKIGRVTALDPAGPLYQGIDESRRLDASDAAFVDVIHTNEGLLGYLGSCGQVDFFPNCGTHQSGCLQTGNDTKPGDILDLPTTAVGCSHLRAVEFFTESINSDKFVSKPSVVPGLCLPFWFPTINMGEHLREAPKDKKFWCRTNSKPPFAKG